MVGNKEVDLGALHVRLSADDNNWANKLADDGAVEVGKLKDAVDALAKKFRPVFGWRATSSRTRSR